MKTFKDRAIEVLDYSQTEMPRTRAYFLLATSFVYAFMWLVEMIEKRGTDAKP